MRQKLFGHAVMGLVSVACVCGGEVPYSLIPLAVLIYGILPTRSVRQGAYCGRPPYAARRLGTRRFIADEGPGDLLRRAEEAAEQGGLRSAFVAGERPAASSFPEETFEETFV